MAEWLGLHEIPDFGRAVMGKSSGHTENSRLFHIRLSSPNEGSIHPASTGFRKYRSTEKP